jgi:molecular chaperone GrpE (heat shock protein)
VEEMNKCIDEQRLKDKEIIDGLKHCKDGECIKCPFNNGSASCLDLLNENALELIFRLKADVNNYRTRVGNQREELARLNEQVNEQKAEIEQWKEEANKYQNLWCEAVKDIQTAKSEAYKEFADGLVTMFSNINESLNSEDIVENIKRFSNGVTEKNDFKEC